MWIVGPSKSLGTHTPSSVNILGLDPLVFGGTNSVEEAARLLLGYRPEKYVFKSVRDQSSLEKWVSAVVVKRRARKGSRDANAISSMLHWQRCTAQRGVAGPMEPERGARGGLRVWPPKLAEDELWLKTWFSLTS